MPKFTLQFSEQALRNARALRSSMSSTERAVWNDLRGDKLGVRFRRQAPFGPYILDFFAIQGMLAIELDGPEHRNPDAQEHDRRRDAYLAEHGVRVLRYDNQRVHLHWEEVLAEIREVLHERLELR